MTRELRGAKLSIYSSLIERYLQGTQRNDEAARGLFPLIIKCSDQVE
jgi:hypothetical protein